MTTAQRIEAECWDLADAYRTANARRAVSEARLGIRPGIKALADARFQAGMDEWTAWDRLVRRTNDLAAAGLTGTASEIRQAASRQATVAFLAAFRRTMREAADAA